MRKALAVSLVGGGLAVSLALALFAVVAGTTYAYRDTFLPKTTIAGIEVGGKTREVAATEIAAKVAGYQEHQFTLVVPNVEKPEGESPNAFEDKEIVAKIADIGMRFDDKRMVERAWDTTHAGSWKDRAFATVNGIMNPISVPLTYQLDRSVLDGYVTEKVAPEVGAPVAATLSLSGEEVVINPERVGFAVSPDELKDIIARRISEVADQEVTYIRVPVKESLADVTAEDLQAVAAHWRELGNQRVELTSENKKVTPTKADVLAWYMPVQDDQKQISLVVAEDKVGSYVGKQKNVDTKKTAAALVKKLAEVIKEPAGQLAGGFTLAMVDKPPASAAVPDNFTPGLYEGKYVEVNLTTQKLYLVDGVNLVKGYLVSTGKWSTPTPTGTFTINGKARRPFSRMYGLYLPYWQNFLGGEYGLHELPEWPNGYKEGQNHLGVPVSHGCVRLGVGDAKEVYEWTENGIPIVIHK